MKKWVLSLNSEAVAVFDSSEDAFNAMYERARRLAAKTNGKLYDDKSLTLTNDNPTVEVLSSSNIMYKYNVILFDTDAINNQDEKREHDEPAAYFMSYCERHRVGEKDADDFLDHLFD